MNNELGPNELGPGEKVPCPTCGHNFAISEMLATLGGEIKKPGVKPIQYWQQVSYSCHCTPNKVLAYDAGDGRIFVVQNPRDVSTVSA